MALGSETQCSGSTARCCLVEAVDCLLLFVGSLLQLALKLSHLAPELRRRNSLDHRWYSAIEFESTPVGNSEITQKCSLFICYSETLIRQANTITCDIYIVLC